MKKTQKKNEKNLIIFNAKKKVRTMDLHHYLLVMSQLCYCYTNPH